MPYRHTTLRKTVGNKLKLLLMLQLLGYESTASPSSMLAIDNLILGAYVEGYLCSPAPLVGFLDCMEAMFGLARTKSSGKR